MITPFQTITIELFLVPVDPTPDQDDAAGILAEQFIKASNSP